jgi:heme-degrading monooxygenase HmoA
MSVVKINAIQVPAERAELLEQRFAARAGEVEKMPGFLGFELLRPTGGDDRYFVYTRWETEEAFQAWVSSEAFTKGHAQAQDPNAAPAASHSSLLEFEVVQKVEPSVTA